MARIPNSQNMLLADEREFTLGDFLTLESVKSPDQTACASCICVFIDGNADLRWGKCEEKRQILCEYKGPSCPKGMYVIAGQCFGIARNSQTNTPDDKNCNWQSDDPNMKLAEISDNPLILGALQTYFNIKKLTEHVIMTKTASSVSISSLTSSGGGAFYAFVYESDSWKLEKIDSEDDALSLCTFHNTDLQCAFNSPYWEALECAWFFQPSQNLISYPLRRMEWVKTDDFTAENYWIKTDPKTDNYHLAGFHTGDYMLLSRWQHENGPRLFYPMFGFAYNAINTNVKVSLYLDGVSTPTVVLDKFVDKIQHDIVDEGWSYFSKNLSDVTFLKDAWASSTQIKWRILIELNVRYHGQFAIDNLGPCSLDEVFFPRAENSNNGIGSCYKIKPQGNVRFEEANDICLDSSNIGSLRSPFSRRDPEFSLLLGALDFLHSTQSDNYDESQADFVPAKERVWEGFQIANAHYIHPKFYADGTSVVCFL